MTTANMHRTASRRLRRAALGLETLMVRVRQADGSIAVQPLPSIDRTAERASWPLDLPQLLAPQLLPLFVVRQYPPTESGGANVGRYVTTVRAQDHAHALRVARGRWPSVILPRLFAVKVPEC